MVKSNPYAELPRPNDKFAASCAELHLGRKGISELFWFEKFTSLHTLWLNNNELISLAGLENNTRLLNLHCHNNRIMRIGGTLRMLKYLVTLTLNCNALNDMDDVLGELQHLSKLTYLDLFDNPITQEDNYRLRVIAALPWVQVLDKHEVGDHERKEAKKVMRRMLKANELLNGKKRNVVQVDEANDIRNAIVIPKEVEQKLKHLVSLKRINLEQDLMRYDPKKLGRVPSDAFTSICNQYSLFDQLSDEEQCLVLSKYTIRDQLGHSMKHHQASSHHALLFSASAGQLYKEFIDYPAFCKDIFPDLLRTQYFDAWAMDPVPEVSTVSADLHRYVARVEHRIAQERERAKEEALLGSTGLTPGDSKVLSRVATAPQSMKRSSTVPSLGTMTKASSQTMSATNLNSTVSAIGSGSSQGLSPWHRSVLRSAVKSICAENGISISKGSIGGGRSAAMIPADASITKILNDMKNYGLIPTTAEESVRKFVMSVADSTGNVDANLLCNIFGCDPVVYKTDKDNQKGNTTKIGQTSCADGNSPLRVEWTEAPLSNKITVEMQRFRESSAFLDNLLRTGHAASSSNPLAVSAMQTATIGTRLMAARDLHPKVEVKPTPTQIIRTDPHMRADAYVLPRLERTPKKASPGTHSIAETSGKSAKKEFPDLEDEWRGQLAAMGLKGHDLDFAIDRKKRSYLRSSGTATSSLSKLVPGNYAPRTPTPLEFVTSKHKSSWNALTATFIIPNDL